MSELHSQPQGGCEEMSKLEAELDASVAVMRRRTVALRVALVLIVGMYLGFLWISYSQINRWDAETVSYLAESHIQEYVARSDELASMLKDRAPQVVAMTESAMLSAPSALADQFRQVVLHWARQTLPEVEEQFVRAARDAIVLARAEADATKVDPRDPAFVARLAEQLPRSIQAELTRTVENVYFQYAARADEVIAHLERLASNDGLSPREAHQRRVVVSFLTLWRQWEIEAGGNLFEKAAEELDRDLWPGPIPSGLEKPDSGDDVEDGPASQRGGGAGLP